MSEMVGAKEGVSAKEAVAPTKKKVSFLQVLFFWLCFHLMLGCRSHHQRARITPTNETSGMAMPSLSPFDVECRPANATVSVATPILNMFAQVVALPLVTAESNMAVVPEHEENHVWTGEMVLHKFALDSLSFETAMQDEHSLGVRARGFGLHVNTTRFRFSYFGIRCYGRFSATLNDTDIDALVNLSLLPERRWNATFTALQLRWGTLAIEHTLDSTMCGIAQSLIELFIGRLDAYIAEKVKSKVNDDGKRRAAEELNRAFASVGIRALTPPLMSASHLTVVLDATPMPVGCPPLPEATEVPVLMQRDVAVHTTVRDVNNALHNAAVHQKLRLEKHLEESLNTSLFSDVLPDIYAMCPECPMYAMAQLPKPPVVVLLPLQTVLTWVEEVVVGLYVVPRSASEKRAVQAAMQEKYNKTDVSFLNAYRAHGIRDDIADGVQEEAIPVLALAGAGTFGVRNVTAATGRFFYYEAMPLQDLAFEVVASNIGVVDTGLLAQQGMRMWNDFVTPMVNLRSPYKLPFYLRKAALNMTLMKIDAGVNVGFMEAVARRVREAFA